MNILIADDHDIFRQSLALLIEARSSHRVIAHAQSFSGLVEQAIRVAPDCMLLDYQMPGGDPLSLSEQLRSQMPELKLILLTGIQSGAALQQLEATLCDGLLHKRDNADTILQGIAEVAEGRHFVSATVAELIADAQVGLTQRELQVLHLFAQGISLHAIAENLSISLRTVEKHKENIMKKLNVVNSIQLVEAAHKLWVGGVQ
ncbi:MAG TPA: response regulator transcription factor [Cellvibrionaceae bacterium]|nr:response regulator transcription factor [Cellvibrionaceae bacterium]HNG61312.1 response regulator transcription factor [Cellvibrionaceae bacterium]